MDSAGSSSSASIIDFLFSGVKSDWLIFVARIALSVSVSNLTVTTLSMAPKPPSSANRSKPLFVIVIDCIK